MILDLRKEKISQIVDKLDPLILKYYTDQGLSDYHKDMGTEHYKLFMSIGYQLGSCKILEIGTHHGNSAVALGSSILLGNKISITSYDICDMIKEQPKSFFELCDIKYRIANIFDDTEREKNKEEILNSDLIFIDIDPHEGILEYDMYIWLMDNNYQGLIMFDDIHLGLEHSANGYRKTEKSMQDFWNKIDDKYKLDITSIGHWSGTGLVSFNLKKYEILM